MSVCEHGYKMGLYVRESAVLVHKYVGMTALSRTFL